MKTMKTILMGLLFPVFCLAQVPQGIKYQVVVRDAYGIPMRNQSLSLRISLLEDSTTGVAAYVETHAVSSNALGLVNLNIGQGSPASGSFAALAWHSHEYHAKIEVDTSGSSNYALLGISQLLTVPYAFHAGSSALLLMSTAERDAISHPYQGMQIVNTSQNCINVYIGSNWQQFCPPEWKCGDTLLDERDGQTYPTVKIGTQCWMAKNLNVGSMINGSNDQANNSTIEKYCYDNDSNNCTIYGGLYQWDEMMDYVTTPMVQGICPDGWHIPTDAEWCVLTTFLDATVNCTTIGWSGTDAGGKMKEAGFTHWDSPNTGATNISGFTALGAGMCFETGNFSYLMNNAYFWSSSEDSSGYGIFRKLDWNSANVFRQSVYKTHRASLRCLRD